MFRGLASVAGCLASVLFVGTASGATAAPTPVARIGMNYFDGWADPVSSFHYDGLVRPGVNGQFPQYRPLSGWRDNSLASMRASLRWAHQDGVDFFFFDWFYNPQSPSPNLNNALTNYSIIPDHDGVGAALFYINIDPFVVPQFDWQATVDQWVTRYFTMPDYTRIDGKPLLYIDDPVRFNDQWGGPAGVNAALAILRADHPTGTLAHVEFRRRHQGHPGRDELRRALSNRSRRRVAGDLDGDPATRVRVPGMERGLQRTKPFLLVHHRARRFGAGDLQTVEVGKSLK
jgi:hypothetical protein